MRRRTFLAGLVLSTALVGTAVAAGAGAFTREHGERAEAFNRERPSDGRFQLADRGRERHHDRDRRHARHHHDDDDDDDDHGDRGRGARLPVTGPVDPNAPVPDNGLFQGKARPKVEVR
ncbi:hypothetical protein [Methyloraptor flagellatus]|jgi:hypothetical protein|uniref:Uncharacterized protein n=1 Tax=Methyloraptor flagellatus TaxID=3162530 RepID=A0AAU7X866_9HYPH